MVFFKTFVIILLKKEVCSIKKTYLKNFFRRLFFQSYYAKKMVTRFNLSFS